MVRFKQTSEAPYITEARYKFTLNELEERESMNPLYPEPQVRWHFTLTSAAGVVQVDDRGFELDFWVHTSHSIGPKSNARSMAEALLGRKIEKGEDPDEIAALLPGRSCTALVADYVREDGSFGGSRPVRGSWAPLKQGQPQRPAQQQRPAPQAAPARRGPPPPEEPEDLDSIPF